MLLSWDRNPVSYSGLNGAVWLFYVLISEYASRPKERPKLTDVQAHWQQRRVGAAGKSDCKQAPVLWLPYVRLANISFIMVSVSVRARETRCPRWYNFVGTPSDAAN